MNTHRTLSMGLAAALALGMAALVGQPVAAAEAGDYLALRQSLKATAFTPAAALSRSTWRGKTFEMVGRVVGRTNSRVLSAEKPLTFMLHIPGVSEIVLVDTAVDDSTLGVDQVVHVLARFAEGASPSDHFQLKAVIAESALPAAEQTYAAAVAQFEVVTPASATTPAPTGTAASDIPDKNLKPEPPADAPAPAPAFKPLPARPGTEQPKVLAAEVATSKVAAWKRWVRDINPKLQDAELELIVRSVLYYSALFGLDHRLAFAMIKCESDFNPRCLSHAGAMGLTQLMPGTARAVGVSNAWDMEKNIMGGLKYLSCQLQAYKDRSNYEQFALGLASYNAGPNAVKRAGGVPAIPETIRYVKKVGDLFYQLYKAGMP